MYNHSFRQSFLSIAVLVLAGGVAAFANSENGSITGTVTDSSGAAVTDAKVELHQVAGSALVITTSDNTGHFEFGNVAGGQYLLDASAPGLGVAQPVSVSVSPGESKNISLNLVVSAVRTQVSVTAASEPQSVDQISKQLDVVQARDAEQRGIFSVGDAIRYLPGVRVNTVGGPGTLTEIQIRGLRTTDTAVLINGFPFRDPTSPQDEASAYIGDLLLVDTSHIEVLQGSGSSLYGSNAMAGVVNIITAAGGGPFHGDVDVQGGGLGLFRGVARGSGGAFDNRLTYSAGVSRLDVTQGVDDAGAVRDWSGQGGITYALKSNMRIGADVFANTGFLQENVSPTTTTTAPVTGIIPAIPLTAAQRQLAEVKLPFDPGSATFVPSLGNPDAGRYSDFVNSLFRFEHEVNSRLSYRLAYGIVSTNRNNTDGPGGPGYQPQFNTSDRYSGRIDTVQGRVNYLFGSHQVVTAGYEFQQEHYRDVSTDQNPDPTQRAYYSTDARQRINAGYFQDELRYLGNRLDILLSGRYTQASLDQPVFVNGGPSPYAGQPLAPPPSAYTGDASVAYFFRSTSTKLRAHVGNSFRLPSLYERFGGFLYQGYDFAYGDPRLAPERAVSGDFGFDQYLFHDHLKISGTYFYTRLQQIIFFEDLPIQYIDPYGRTSGYVNVGGGMSRGVEVSGEFRPTGRTSIFASYTYVNSKDATSQYYTGTSIDPLQIPGILPNTVSIIATQQLGRKIDLALDFLGGSDYLWPLYGVSDFEPHPYQFAGPKQLGLSAGYTLSMSDRISTRFYVRVSNALDQEYYEQGFRTPGRWAVGGVHFSF
ncbi:MAG: TonB-dependent receptor [Acidobacteriaceae bacterium]|nr:TonB-dependent receptor [Acidobacteriaceae bacterium]